MIGVQRKSHGFRKKLRCRKRKETTRGIIRWRTVLWYDLLRLVKKPWTDWQRNCMLWYTKWSVDMIKTRRKIISSHSIHYSYAYLDIYPSSATTVFAIIEAISTLKWNAIARFSYFIIASGNLCASSRMRVTDVVVDRDKTLSLLNLCCRHYLTTAAWE